MRGVGAGQGARCGRLISSPDGPETHARHRGLEEADAWVQRRRAWRGRAGQPPRAKAAGLAVTAACHRGARTTASRPNRDPRAAPGLAVLRPLQRPQRSLVAFSAAEGPRGAAARGHWTRTFVRSKARARAEAAGLGGRLSGLGPSVVQHSQVARCTPRARSPGLGRPRAPAPQCRSGRLDLPVRPPTASAADAGPGEAVVSQSLRTRRFCPKAPASLL